MTLQPYSGQLWAVYLDDTFQMLATVEMFYGDRTVVWPTTRRAEEPYPRGLIVPALGDTFLIYPQYAVGIPTELLKVYCGDILQDHELEPISWAVDDGTEAPYPRQLNGTVIDDRSFIDVANDLSWL